MRQNYFLYRSQPFRPLYLGGYFNVPHKRSCLWLFHDRDVARKMAALNGCEMADFRDYIRLCTGGTAPERGSEKLSPKPRITLDDLA